MNDTLENKFTHLQTAHCENGVTANLLKHNGVDFITEPLAFGIGSGLFYIQIPFLKVNNAPAIAFRSMPGSIFRRTCNSLDIKLARKKFKERQAGMDFLDQKIEEGILVGCQVGVFHLPYFPREYRFHFNAHNLLVYGKEGDNYLVSDPVMEGVTTINKRALERARFAQGALAPKGQIYYPLNVPEINNEAIVKSIKKGIRTNTWFMSGIPTKILGTKGIKRTAGKIKKWHNTLEEKEAARYLGQVVRMQEEIGTGGGGFRFLFAAFLEQSYEYIKNDDLLKISEDFTKAGDMWRDSAVQMAGIIKGRLSGKQAYADSAEILNQISEVEKRAFESLKKVKL